MDRILPYNTISSSIARTKETRKWQIRRNIAEIMDHKWNWRKLLGLCFYKCLKIWISAFALHVWFSLVFALSPLCSTPHFIHHPHYIKQSESSHVIITGRKVNFISFSSLVMGNSFGLKPSNGIIMGTNDRLGTPFPLAMPVLVFSHFVVSLFFAFDCLWNCQGTIIFGRHNQKDPKYYLQ